MGNLKEKDKKMLVFLAVFVMLVLTLTQVIMPVMEKRTAIEAEMTEMESGKTAMDAKLATYEANKLIYPAVAEDHAAAAADFFALMENEAIDRLITGIVLDNGLEARDLIISGGESPQTIAPYYASAAAAGVQAEGADSAKVYVSGLDLVAEGAETATETQETVDRRVVYVSSLKLRVGGAENRLFSLIDLFTNEYPAIRVTGYSMRDDPSGGKSLDLSLELYMCEK